jgi:hypothetical protein
MQAAKPFHRSCPPFIRTGFVDITPVGMSLELAGYGSKVKAVKSAERLEINCIWFGDDTSGIILASVDCLFAGSDIRAAIARYSQLPEEAVIVVASHTHSAPALERTKPTLGEANEEWVEFVHKSVNRLIHEMKSQKKSPFASGMGRFATSAGVSRRSFWPLPHLGGRRNPIIGPGIMNAPNWKAYVNTDIRTNLIEDQEGQRLGLLWSLACHPNRYFELSIVSSDFVGHVREHLRREMGADLPVVFLQGFSGDINPRTTHATRQNLLTKLIFGPQPEYFDRRQWHAWANRIAGAAEHSLATTSAPKPSNGNVELTSVKFPLRELLPEASAYPVEMMRLSFGEFDSLLVSAEVVNEYVVNLSDSIWPIGCANDVYGYWPTSKQVDEGGYEVSGFLAPFGLPGNLTADTDSVFFRHAEQLGLKCKK